MTKAEILDLVGKTAREAQIRDDVCSRSTLLGLAAYFDFIPEDMIRASFSLCGGAGASSGSCGTYTCGLLALGLKYNAPVEEELKNPELQEKGQAKFMEFRDRFIKEMGSTLCPELQKKIFGRSYIFTNPKDCEEYFKITDHNVKCAEVVEKATRLIAEMLLED
ncbi:MAG: C_GCAxxG_C_C family protein [Clostridiales bacterium]|jgi:C_GCAxxG_C_C family probable redox protein|nr:C_GCAxxG_C_C family protein [Clostridiales bacterium]